MKIALVTDLHAEEDFTTKNGVSPWDNWKIILADIQAKGIKQVVFLGDIGSQAAHRQFFDALDQSKLDYKVILGNHDHFAEVVQSYKPATINDREEWYWSEENERFKSIYLDTSTEMISQLQLDWLKAEVQTEKPILLFIHHPILQTHTTPQLEFPLAGADQVKQVLLTHNRPVHVYCGHLHLDDYTTEDNISQTVTPSASIQIKRHSKKAEVENIGFAYRILDFSENKLCSEVIWFDRDQ
ncbi:Icc protein [Reichenbachiella faecimaris]|uniref:Icc protein n=1 Tax=Reichenbachiella faecimaris TaxID=692418 RepID=A0A1W2G729_REIFA|nr:metallophosphoesterase [Reichenbachiella faecimaris]SMD32242.1 Icc protein [Reichenbachiella faecimaris]